MFWLNPLSLPSLATPMFAPKAHKIIRNITQILKINAFLSNNFLVLLHVFIVKYKYRQVLLSTFAPKTRNNTHI